MPLIFILFAVVFAIEPMAFEQPHWKQGILLLAGGLALLPSALRGKLRQVSSTRLPLPLLSLSLLLVFYLVSTMVIARYHPDAVLATALLFIYLIATIQAHETSYNTPLRLPSVLVVVGTLVAVTAVMQARGFEFPFDDPEDRNWAVSWFGNTNLTGEFLAPLLPLALVLSAVSRGTTRGWTTLCVPILAAGVVLSGSRGAWLAACVGIIVAPLVIRPLVQRKFLTAKTAVLLLVGVGLAVVAGGTSVLIPKSATDSEESIASPDYTTNKQRLLLLKSGWKMAEDAPVLGHGPGIFRATFPPYRDPEEAAIRTLGGAASSAEDPHNQYLLLLDESGALGLLLFLLFALPALFAVRHATLLPEKDRRRAVAAAQGVAILTFLVVMLFRSALTHPPSALTFFLLCGANLPYRDSVMATTTTTPNRRWLELLLPLYLVIAVLIGGRLLLGDFLLAQSARARQEAIDNHDISMQNRSDELLGWAVNADNSNLYTLQFQAALFELDGLDTQTGRDRARAIRTRILELHPHHRRSLIRLAGISLLDGRNDAARRLLERAARLRTANDPEDPALLLESAGMPEAAIKLLIEQAHLGEVSALELMRRAKEADHQGKRDVALSAYLAILEVIPFDGDAAFRAGELQQDLGHEEEKADLFARAHLAFALEYLGQRKYDAATRSAGLSLYHLDSKEADLILLLADYGRGDRDELEAYLDQKRPDLDPDFLMALLRLEGNRDLETPIRALTGRRR